MNGAESRSEDEEKTTKMLFFSNDSPGTYFHIVRMHLVHRSTFCHHDDPTIKHQQSKTFGSIITIIRTKMNST